MMPDTFSLPFAGYVRVWRGGALRLPAILRYQLHVEYQHSAAVASASSEVTCHVSDIRDTKEVIAAQSKIELGYIHIFTVCIQLLHPIHSLVLSNLQVNVALQSRTTTFNISLSEVYGSFDEVCSVLFFGCGAP